MSSKIESSETEMYEGHPNVVDQMAVRTSSGVRSPL